jgi:hypothetical protein
MKSGIDFIYEYSDLNYLQTRVHILTGMYEDIILEFGGSVLGQDGVNPNKFVFKSELMQLPYSLKDTQLKGTKEFEEFLAYLLVDIIEAKKQDPDEHQKLMDAIDGNPPGNIKIDELFYPEWIIKAKKQPITQGLQGF